MFFFHKMRYQMRHQISIIYKIRLLTKAQQFAVDMFKVDLSDSEAVLFCRKEPLPYTKIEKNCFPAVLETRTSSDK